MELSAKPILPGSVVVVKDNNSIYRELLSFTTTKEPGSIGLVDNSMKHSF